MDIINELLMIPAARKAFQNTPDDAKTCVCVASKLLRSALNKQAPTNAAWGMIAITHYYATDCILNAAYLNKTFYMYS